MWKWIAGIAGAVITGTLLWVLTNVFFPQWFSHRTPPPEDKIRVECSTNPATVSPGGVTEISVKVMLNDEPVEGAAVKLHIDGGRTGRTYSGGVYRTTWTAPSPSSSGYVFPAEVDLEGVRTPKGELHGHGRTDCEILVR
jgi:hypothetical protein